MRQALSDSIDDYMKNAASRGLAAGTLKGQREILRRFLTVTGNILTENVHEGHVDVYFLRAAEKRSARSLRLDTSTLRTFFQWATRTRRLGRNGNPMGDRRPPRAAPRPWRGVSVSKFPAILDATKHPRDRILLAMGMYLLGRSIEFSELRVGDLRLEDGEITYRIPKTFKTDVLPITTELDEELRVWLTFYTEECGLLDPNWRLVPAKTPPKPAGRGHIVPNSSRLVPSRPVREMHGIAKKALTAVGFAVKDENGKPLNEGMHTLRRSAARALAEQLRDESDPNPVETVRSMLNHATEAETRRYIGWESSRIHRDARLKGKPMFPGLRAPNVTQMGTARQAREEVRTANG